MSSDESLKIEDQTISTIAPHHGGKIENLPTEKDLLTQDSRVISDSTKFRHERSLRLDPSEESDEEEKIRRLKEFFESTPETEVGDYRVGKVLGKGAFGKVNLAMQKTFKTLVAIKSISK